MSVCGPGKGREAGYYCLLAVSVSTTQENFRGECVDQGQPDEVGQEPSFFPSLKGYTNRCSILVDNIMEAPANAEQGAALGLTSGHSSFFFF